MKLDPHYHHSTSRPPPPPPSRPPPLTRLGRSRPVLHMSHPSYFHGAPPAAAGHANSIDMRAAHTSPWPDPTQPGAVSARRPGGRGGSRRCGGGAVVGQASWGRLTSGNLRPHGTHETEVPQTDPHCGVCYPLWRATRHGQARAVDSVTTSGRARAGPAQLRAADLVVRDSAGEEEQHLTRGAGLQPNARRGGNINHYCLPNQWGDINGTVNKPS